MKPFVFYECVNLLIPTGEKASNLREFLTILKRVDENVIFHHLHQFHLKHHFEIWEYPNDFSIWAARGLGDIKLAEKFANFDPYLFDNMEEVRNALVELIEDHLWDMAFVPSVRPGFEFYFNNSKTIVIPSGIEAHDLVEFRNAISNIHPSSIYYHFYESRIRLKIKSDDFSLWIEENFNCPSLVNEIRNIDFYFYSLEELRIELLILLNKYIE